ncbi:MAG: hypothetical protein SGARI_004261 [Bacillariaceae sp.]
MGGPDGRYLGIQRFRFYIKCVMCKRTISFLTDPKNADYEMETGGTRNYEVYKDKAKTEEESAQEKVEDEKEDPMRALENRVLDSQREMADMDNLEAIQAMNRNHLKLMNSMQIEEGWDADTKAVLAALDKKDQAKEDVLNEHGITAKDEELVKSIKFGQQQPNKAKGERTTVRLSEEDERREEERRQHNIEMMKQRQQELEMKAAKVPVIKVKRKIKQQPIKKKKESPKKDDAGGGLASLLGGYGSDSDSD